jgi:hypothetical protein
MDAHTFDRLIVEAARRPSRRTALWLLAGGMLGALLPARGARAQRSDRDGDGLWDDDEVPELYGTNPDDWDTDDDGVGDGEEIYNRDQGLDGPKDPLVNENAAPAPPAPTCRGLGVRCDSNAECCNSTGAILCCFDGTALDTLCKDTAATGFVCPGDPPAPAPAPGPGPCPAGQTDCGGSCVDTASHAAHCGACFKSCPLGGICRGSVCVAG